MDTGPMCLSLSRHRSTIVSLGITIYLYLLFTSCAPRDSDHDTIEIDKNRSALESYLTISVDPHTHIDYGLSYPLTYEFSIPAGSNNLKVYKKYFSSDGWSPLLQKTSGDFFNGIDVVRFDYVNTIAYVSVTFSNVSDKIFLKFTDSSNSTINVTYNGTSQYYDHRRAVVTASADDWYDLTDSKFISACIAFRNSNIWLTTGIITGNNPWPMSATTWNDIQTQLDLGYIEAASHSRSHPLTTGMTNYQATKYWKKFNSYQEVEGSKQDIITRLNLPANFRNGDKEYVYTWIEPCGYMNLYILQHVAKSKYLVDRSTKESFYGISDWNSHGLYSRVDTAAMIEKNEEDELNRRFDSAYSSGGVYHVYFHPINFNWGDPNNKALGHINYIKNKADIWYASVGQLYLYQFMKKNAYNGCIRCPAPK